MTHTSHFSRLLAMLVLCGCSGSAENSIVVVTVTAPANTPTVTQLRVVVANASSSETRLFPQAPVATGITFDTTLAVTFPTSRQGYLGVTVAALGVGSAVVADGDGTVRIVPGGRADVTVPLVLRAPPVAIDGGILDAGATPDAPTQPDTAADVGRDLRGTGGNVGPGTGGIVSTGGVSSVPMGSGGITSTGGTSGRGTGGAAGSGGASTGGRTSVSGGAGGASSIGSGGRMGTGGVRGTGGAVGIDGGGEEPCVPAKTITATAGNGSSGDFGTIGAFCFRTPDSIMGWGCSNMTGRTLKVNDVVTECGGKLPPKLNGYYYFEASGGTTSYAAIYWY